MVNFGFSYEINENMCAGCCRGAAENSAAGLSQLAREAETTPKGAILPDSDRRLSDIFQKRPIFERELLISGNF